MTDQRGTARPQDGDSNGSFICDMGAYEALGGPVAGTDLAVAMTDDQDPVTFNALFSHMITIANNGPDDATPDERDTVSYTIGVNNSGPAAATTVQISDVLPAGVTFSSATPSQGLYDSVSGNWHIGTLSAGSSVTLAIAAMVDAGTAGSTITNTAGVAYVSQPDSNRGNDSASADIIPTGGQACWS